MEPFPSFATSITNSMSNLWKDETLADFTLIVDDSIFKCHRFILGACSQFFYALFTTNMKEKRDNSARLQDIDPSAFELTLKTLYTGENVVTEENVFSIWQCAHRLQIPFLIEHCEKLAISILSIENFADFSRAATVLGSQTALEVMDKFILKNFMKVKDNKVFLEFSASKLTELIQSDELEVSCEDDVLLFIYKWADSSSFEGQNVTNNGNSGISGGPVETLKDGILTLNKESNLETQSDLTYSNGKVSEVFMLKKDVLEMYKPLQNRSVYLESLLKASRSCLASPQCLQTLYKHRLTQKDERVRAVVIDAIFYQMKGYHHGYFPPAASHRNSSEFEHVGVIAYDTGSTHVLSLARNKWYPMPTCEDIKNKIKIALFDSDIYALGQADDIHSKLCVLKENSWFIQAKLPGLKYLLLSHKTFLYVFNTSDGKVLRMNPSSSDKTPKKLKHPKSFTDMEFALSFKEYILVFSKDSVGGKEETAVHIMNTLDETWHRNVNLAGPAKKMASFQDGDKVYLLQNNGNLWSITIDNAEMITFQFIKKIWEAKESLRGALLYKGKLFLFVKLPWANLVDEILNSIPGIYTSYQRWARVGYASNFICTVMHNLDMVKK